MAALYDSSPRDEEFKSEILDEIGKRTGKHVDKLLPSGGAEILMNSPIDEKGGENLPEKSEKELEEIKEKRYGAVEEAILGAYHWSRLNTEGCRKHVIDLEESLADQERKLADYEKELLELERDLTTRGLLEDALYRWGRGVMDPQP